MSRKNKNRKKKKSIIDKTINSLKNQSSWFWTVMLITILIDALNSIYFEKTQSFFFEILAGRDQKSILTLISFFVLLIIILIVTSSMSSYKNKRVRKKSIDGLFLFMISGFGIIMIMAAAYILGMTDDVSNFSDNEQYTYIMIFIGLFFALLISSVVAGGNIKFHLGERKYFIIYIIVLILVSAFVDFSSAMWKSFIFDPENIANPARASRIIEFIAIFPLFALFFSAPRFILLRKSSNILSIISAFAMTMYFVWKSLEFMEI